MFRTLQHNWLVYSLVLNVPSNFTTRHGKVMSKQLIVPCNFRLFRKGGGLQLQHLDVSGCKNITDKTLFKLSSSLGKLPVGSGISDIEDSSCDCHTLCSCGKLDSISPVTVKRGLVYLGLSGCYQVTNSGLR